MMMEQTLKRMHASWSANAATLGVTHSVLDDLSE